MRILSGMQPTNQLHLGNYLGALRHWVALQEVAAKQGGEALYCVVDLHAITVPQDPDALRRSTREVTAAYLAAGVDPQQSHIFVQSHVRAHTELAWLLACHTPLGWLNRMTQFKEKAGKKRDEAVLGLYAYPVLMAADVLAYHASHVPVGEDQKQHLELARDIAGAINRRFEREIFPLPEPMIMGEATRVMSLRDGTKKMSKSDESEYSRINLTDDADAIALKIRKARTDSEPLPSEVAGLEGRPEAENLVTIYAALSDSSKAAVLAELGGSQFSEFKGKLAELLIERISPMTAKMRELLADPAEIDLILAAGAAKARRIADPVVAELLQALGFLPPPQSRY